MKSIFIICLTILTTSIISQTKTFNLSDSILAVGQEYTTRQIYFELGKAILKPESNPVLDSLVMFMNLNKKLKLEIGVHSDSRTNSNCCDKPTENRARSIAQYLINQSISPDRIVAKGYGESKLLIKDEQISKVKTKAKKEALHALNRRIVFKIIEQQQK
jgi:outer membrane protein OmpA-like peptidoglycan-associated protein